MKLIKDGKVAVLISPGYGAGWSTWGDSKSCFDGELAQAILDEKPKAELVSIANKNWPDQYTGGIYQLYVEWIPEKVAFRINEYDGSESLEIISEIDYLVA